MRRAIGLLLVLACSGESTGPTRAEIAGIWVLQTINGQPLPVRVDHGQSFPDYTDIVADSLILRDGPGNVERTRLHDVATPPDSVCCARDHAFTVVTPLT
jgi:hypothetical protein